MAHRRWKKLAAVAAGVFAAALVAEIGLRLIGFSHPPFYRVDAHRGWVLAPGERGWYSAEGHSFVAISSAGLREEEQPRAKPAGELRVAVLGDSMTEALQVPRQDTFVEVAERRLAACPHLPPGTRSVEVLNFGVSGYGTAQELLTLRHAALAWQPDVVVLAFYTGNDVRNNDRELEGGDRRPYFRLGDDGEPVLDDSFRHRLGFRLRHAPAAAAAYSVARHVRLVQLAAAVWSRLRQGPSGPPPGELHPGDDDAIYVPPADAGGAWERAWRVSEALVRLSAAESRAAGARFLLLSLSTGAQIYPDSELRRRFAAELGVTDLLYPERRLAALARRDGIPYLALAPRLARRAEHGRAQPGGGKLHGAHGFGHWNAAGHRAAGGLLADRLCRMLGAGEDGGDGGGDGTALASAGGS